MAAQKRTPHALAAHAAVVLATAIAATGTLDLGLLWLTAIHVAIDAIKARMKPRLATFLIDQAAHLATLAALAWWQPDLWANGLWADLTQLPALILAVAGAIIATRAGGFAVGFLKPPSPQTCPTRSAPKACPVPAASSAIWNAG